MRRFTVRLCALLSAVISLLGVERPATYDHLHRGVPEDGVASSLFRLPIPFLRTELTHFCLYVHAGALAVSARRVSALTETSGAANMATAQKRHIKCAKNAFRALRPPFDHAASTP